MNSFTTVCPTCQSRIRVRRPELVGQLANCPKCNSIVLLARADQIRVAANEGSPIDSAALTRDGIELETVSLSPTDHVTSGLLADSLTPENRISNSDSVDFAEVDLSEQSFQLEGGTSENAGQTVPPTFQGNVQRAAINQPWTSTNTNRLRQYLLVGFLGTAGIVVAALVFISFSRWYLGRRSTELAGTHVATAEPASETSEQADQSQSDFIGENATKPTVPSPLIELTYPDEDRPDDQPSSIDDNEVAAVSEPIEIELPDPDAEKEPKGQSTVQEQPAVATTPSDTEASESLTALPKQLQELYAVIAEPFALSMPQQIVVPDRPPVTAQELGLTGISGDKLLPPIDLAKVASERWVRGLRMDAVSPARAVSALSAVAGVPTQVDLDSLDAIGFDGNSKLSLIIEPGPVAKVASQFAKKTGLVIESIDNQFWRIKAAAPDKQRLPWSMEIKDLVSPEQEEWFAAAIGRLMPDRQATVRVESGVLHWDNQPVDMASWFAVVRLLENWRLQKGLARQLTQYEDSQLRQELVTPAGVAGLQANLNTTTSAPRALANFISHASAQAGINCWVDWPALARLGLGPQSSVLSVTRNRTLGEILQEFAFEHGLVTLIIDQQNLCLTDTQAYRRRTCPLVLPSRGKGVDDYWSSWLRPLTGVDSSGVAHLPIELTPDQQFVLVRCCWPTLQFSDQ